MPGIKQTLKTYMLDLFDAGDYPADSDDVADRLGDALINANDIGGGGGTAISAVNIAGLSGVVAAYSFEGNTQDRSGAGRHLNTGVGSVQYATIQGKRCAFRTLVDEWGRSTHDAELALTGELTVHHLVNIFESRPHASSFFYSFCNSGDGVAADNYLWALRIYSSSSNSWNVAYFHEHGTGTNVEHDFGVQSPINKWTLLTLTRNAAGTGVKLYIDGNPAGTNGSGLTAPAGGSASKLNLFSPDFTPRTLLGYVGDHVVQNVEMSAADILAVAQQVGVAA